MLSLKYRHDRNQYHYRHGSHKDAKNHVRVGKQTRRPCDRSCIGYHEDDIRAAKAVHHLQR